MPEEKPNSGPGLPPASPAQADALHKYAHDLKNRLSGLLEVVRQVKESADQRELLDFGEKQAFAMLERTEQMLDALGVPRGVGQLNLTSVEMADLVQTAIDNQRYRFDKKQQRLVFRPASGVLCRADARHLPATVEALLSNASKFSAPGGTVEIHLLRSADQGILTVKDSGSGLTETDLQRIFIRYAWLDSQTTGGESQGRSSLAVCKRTIDAMGGALTAHSDGPGKGCTFTLALPLQG